MIVLNGQSSKLTPNDTLHPYVIESLDIHLRNLCFQKMVLTQRPRRSTQKEYRAEAGEFSALQKGVTDEERETFLDTTGQFTYELLQQL